MALIATRGIGSAGTMEIWDDGSTILMRIRSSDSATNSGAIPIKALFNGSWSDWTYVNYPSGSPWVNVWAQGVSTSQTVAFQVGDTGTMGFGAGGQLSAAVNRTPPASKPGTPGTPVASNVSVDRLTLSWTIPSNGGATIDQMLLRRSSTSDFASYVDYPRAGNATSYEVTGLTPGQDYYWRVYAHNSVGYSNPSGTLKQATLGGGRLKVAGAWRDVARWMKVAGVWKRTTRWVKVAGVWKRSR